MLETEKPPISPEWSDGQRLVVIAEIVRSLEDLFHLRETRDMLPLLSLLATASSAELEAHRGELGPFFPVDPE